MAFEAFGCRVGSPATREDFHGLASCRSLGRSTLMPDRSSTSFFADCVSYSSCSYMHKGDCWYMLVMARGICVSLLSVLFFQSLIYHAILVGALRHPKPKDLKQRMGSLARPF